ncbi:MAG: tetratricopeptide repeat protein [Betaproteobacteria bacterium]|nr:tetratricopeptide repeat protein [Betaproteobacteria bacterium]
MKKIGRNDPCPCGSSKRYKQCCGSLEEVQAARTHSLDTSIPEAIQTAREHHQAGRLLQAEAIYRQILQAAPNHPDALHLLGVIAHQTGKNELAVELISKAISVNPSSSMYCNLGFALNDQGKLDAAVESYRKALSIKPDFAEAHSNLGIALQQQGKLDAAIESYQKAASIKPDFAEVHSNLGIALQQQGKLDAAVESYRKALSIKADFAEVHSNLGIALKDQGKLEAAIESYHKALSIKPNFAEAHSNLGNALKDQGKLDAAIENYLEALSISPHDAKAYSNLGLALNDQGKLDAAIENYLKALSIRPDYAEAHYNLGNALKDQGKIDAAVESYRKALSIKPDYAEAYSNLLFVYGYHALVDPHEYLARARNWEQACVPAQDRQAARHRVFQRSPRAGRRLRVGYVSGDYRQHSVSYFVKQLFAHHDRTRIELFAYSTHGQRDAVTDRLQALAEHWVPLVGIPDAAIRERIEADGIDVLIDLSGHTRHDRLGVFARRAAPVQAHYLGYFASTGLTEMDYWIGDEILTPAGTDSHFSEQVWRLPRVWLSYDGKAGAPLIDWHPAQDGTVWLGSFNNLGKLTPATLALWAKVLHALPEGKLLLKTKELSAISNRQRILDAMSGHGILPDRIELQDSSVTPDWFAHMAYYDRLDIALDPVGAVGGGTTNCDALWMAVPVIGLKGDRMASLMTTSMLNAIGRPEWIAHSEAEYIDKVVALARDVEQRKAIRSSQRSRMASSPLCDARGLAMSLENAYSEMFERWHDRKFDEKS